ncbi:hypothetical protein BDR05DRAFT_434180 [Suillus weaverae]|nr:hypothetical protein BDR05DRAFT_434180 [Suillus weaverae]
MVTRGDALDGYALKQPQANTYICGELESSFPQFPSSGSLSEILQRNFMFHQRDGRHEGREERLHDRREEFEERLHGRREALEERRFGHGREREHSEERGHGRQREHSEERGHGRHREHSEERGHGRHEEHSEERRHGRREEHSGERRHERYEEHRRDPRTLENGIDRDHPRTLVTKHHTCSSPNRQACDSLRHLCHPSLLHSAHLAMRAVHILSPLTTSILFQNRWTHVMEAMCTRPLLVLLGHHPVMRQREVMLRPLGRPLQLDMDTRLLPKEDRAEVLRVTITMGLRQVNQHSHICTPQITQPLMAIPLTHLATSLTPRAGSTKRITSLISLLTLRRMVPVMMTSRWQMMISAQLPLSRH